jgi:hypothetical protein
VKSPPPLIAPLAFIKSYPALFICILAESKWGPGLKFIHLVLYFMMGKTMLPTATPLKVTPTKLVTGPNLNDTLGSNIPNPIKWLATGVIIADPKRVKFPFA